MEDKAYKRQVGALVFLLAFVYFTSYISRINLGAVLVEIISSGFADRRIASLAVVASRVTYGAGQIISGYLGDKCRPQSVIFVGFIITAAMNFGVFFIKESTLLIPFWAINGFAQALMWPPMMRIMTKFFSQDEFQSACVKVSYGSASGTIAVYLFSPVFISLFGFKSVFAFCGSVALAVGLIWKVWFEKLRRKEWKTDGGSVVKITDNKNLSSANKAMSIIVLAAIMISVIFQGALRDGITTWMPSYISETFNLDGAVSILTGVVMPIFAMFSLKLTQIVSSKILKNELVCSGVVFSLTVVCALILGVFSDKNIALSVFLSAVLIGCMHAVNFVLVCVVPPYFAKQGKVSLVSGIINSCTYVGSAVSTYAIAIFSADYGWKNTIMLWAAIALGGAVLCFAFKNAWKKYIKEA